MELELKIQTDEYAYIGLKLAPGEMLTQEMISGASEDYRRLKAGYKGGEGISEKDMDMIVQKMLQAVPVNGGSELWAKASQQQRDEINRVKRALNRITYSEKKEEVEDITYGDDGRKDQGERDLN